MNPVEQSQTPVLIYDGDCKLCKACLRFLLARCDKSLTCVPYQDMDFSKLETTYEQCEQAVVWVDADGSTHTAHMAVAKALGHARKPWPWLGMLIRLKGINGVSARVYYAVARRRKCL